MQRYTVTMRSLRLSLLPADPLALSSGAGTRLRLAAAVLALVWAGVAWAIRW